MTDANRPTRLDRRARAGRAAGRRGRRVGVPCAGCAPRRRTRRRRRSIESIEIEARPIAHFERGRPEVKRFGALEFRGGLVLSSPAADFGGWSALVMEPDGQEPARHLRRGQLAQRRSRLRRQPAARPDARAARPAARQGRPAAREQGEQDAEAVTLLDGTLQSGTLLIGFERLHRIDRYPIRDGEVQAPTGTLKLPAEAKRMPTNQGIEALAVLKGGPYKGSIVAFAERFTRGSGYHTGWIWVGGGEPQRFQLQDIDGFNITDAAGLAGRQPARARALLPLDRGREDAPAPYPGRRDRARRAHHRPHAVPGRLELRDRQHGGPGRARGAGGETVLSLISDDNFNHFLQRTVFLQFTLHDVD